MDKMYERFDAYLYIQVVNRDGDICNEHEWKIRCSDFLTFVKDVHKLYLQHHPGDMARGPICTKKLNTEDLKGAGN